MKPILDKNQKTLYDIIEENGTIFKEKKVFTTDYIPESYKYRDMQLKKMAILSKGIREGLTPSNMILNGKTATGKTSSLLKFFELLEKRYENVITVLVNCQINRTEYKIYTKIYKKIFGIEISVGGLSTFNIYTRIMEYISKENKVLIVGLDDYDVIKSNKELNKTLYTLLRAYESFKNAKVSVIATTNNLETILTDSAVASTFHPSEVQFISYTQSQIKNILKERCRLGFYKGVINDKIIDDLVNYVYYKGDLRIAIKMLLNAGNNAESRNSVKIAKFDFK
ncbi:AAA family ATPase [Methanobrevibacter curvatus]|uniref:Cell division control protein 6 n=1 Tax=Methanobrevibacter curvatus TaxID=49547 RepID=A0A166DEV9_9EURY|nr:AAA family ATPase [Methanobrevibacter curvatus]KZX15524.1 cell division control protein 6 [Methanobrevibacter curvatus]